MARGKDDLWRNFPKTAIEFERRFATEEACRAYWIEARWGGEPACARMIADGSLPQLMQETLGRLQPESAYFGPEGGVRTAFVVFDLKDPSELPAVTEPLFNQLKAQVEMFPVMNQEDLQTGLQQLGGDR